MNISFGLFFVLFIFSVLVDGAKAKRSDEDKQTRKPKKGNAPKLSSTNLKENAKQKVNKLNSDFDNSMKHAGYFSDEFKLPVVSKPLGAAIEGGELPPTATKIVDHDAKKKSKVLCFRLISLIRCSCFFDDCFMHFNYKKKRKKKKNL
jgi:hypothetical protein